jgi:hypothetical protein
MALACLASLAILADGMAALYGIEWYRGKRRKSTRNTRIDTTRQEEQQPTAEQLA